MGALIAWRRTLYSRRSDAAVAEANLSGMTAEASIPVGGEWELNDAAIAAAAEQDVARAKVVQADGN